MTIKDTIVLSAPGESAALTPALPAMPAAASDSSRTLPKTPVVGIGASAGGLEALEKFFLRVPAHSGLAFVVVQHLDPLKKSLLVELLQRVSTIPVVQVEDRTKVEADHVYVGPPGFEVTILHGVLHLLKPMATHRLRLPIDFFLRALAVDQQANAAGVILSGMGSDGTLGLRALKENAGGVFVQTPETARFDPMPRSAVQAALADVVAPAEQLPEKIMAYFAHAMLPHRLDGKAGERAHAALEKVLILVRAQTGHDFSYYKKSTVYRRLQRRMAIHQLATVEDYVHYVRQNHLEAELLFKELLIGVTSFFRDPDVWQHLKTEVIPQLLASQPEGGVLRAWVAACSTGEEAYTLAMVFTEVISELQPAAHFSLQIFATDLDKDAVDKARTGSYPENIASDVSQERLQRFFAGAPRGYVVGKAIREMVVFAQQSITSDPPFAKLNILTCRNLLIYLEVKLQQSLLPLFHRSLRPGGFLVLGSAETLGQSGDLFTPVGAKTHIYRRLDVPVRLCADGLPVHNVAAGVAAPAQVLRAAHAPAYAPGLQTLADQLLLRKFAPSAVLVTAEGDIVYFSGKTGKYLEPAAGKANLNLFAMARPGLSQPLAEIFYRAVRQKAAVTIDEVVVGATGRTQSFSVTVEPLDEPDSLQGLVMVVFSDFLPAALPVAALLSGEAGHDARLSELMRELARCREEHLSTREQMQTSQEELKSANEELQSANEELTTSREEMQSMNEELQTVNNELQTRVDALALASDDMENLLNSTDIATLFLDKFLKIRRFTPRTTSLIKLLPGDAGRPVTDIVSDLDYPGLADDASEVLRTLMFKEKEVSATGGRWFMVRTMPYRTQDSRIDGVVITFTDISIAKRLEASLRHAQVGPDGASKHLQGTKRRCRRVFMRGRPCRRPTGCTPPLLSPKCCADSARASLSGWLQLRQVLQAFQ